MKIKTIKQNQKINISEFKSQFHKARNSTGNLNDQLHDRKKKYKKIQNTN